MSRDTVVKILGGGALAFGVLGVVDPPRLARMMGADDETAREVGFRDVGNGLLLLASPDPRPAIAQRALYDVADAVMFGRRKPGVAAGALGFAALALYGLFAAD
ncbi:MAG TPA: hypothetical protein VHK22_02590 [Gaiellaceae bacterium]|jgi:hypothetical protein|nr:hypothetical protein [Gaiellaceae bacterium]